MEPIVHSFAYSLDYLRDLIADVPEESMTEQPNGIVNHPTWTIGHLVFIAQAIGGLIGVDPWLSEDWERKFGPASNPSDLSTGPQASPRATPPSGVTLNMADLLTALDTALDTAQSKLTTAVESLTKAELDEPFPDPTYADVFPTVRHALTQALLGHSAFHIGQVSVWRRAVNFPPLGRSYE